MINIGFAITGSFCTHEKILEQIQKLTNMKYNIIPIITESVKNLDTRFGKANDFCAKVEKICGNPIIDNIVSAEPIGPNNLIDILVIAPCTGNTLSKLAKSITDNAVTMVAKSHIRNNKPVIIGISTNDALGLNLNSIAILLNSKNFYFIPFGQDDYIKKPKSLVANWNLLPQTIELALKNEQIQPILTK